MGRKILLDRNLSGFAVLQPLLVAFGYEVETLADPDASVVPPVEGVAAIIIPMAGSGGWAAEVVNRFRQAGYQGIIGVAGIYTPEIDARCRLAEKNASFIPAMSGPIDTAMRIRRLLPPA
ncbi:MAG: hypothetical protein LBU79_08290 [Planctomycetota bacterium]|jgi:hypothetical protein|nr:hypothetical protein [Planctomycetota bacterium]